MADEKYKQKLEAWRERRKKIVSLRDDSKLTFEQIGKIYDVSRQRIRQIYEYEVA